MTEHHVATETTQPGAAVWWPRCSVLGVSGCCNDFLTHLEDGCMDPMNLLLV